MQTFLTGTAAVVSRENSPEVASASCRTGQTRLVDQDEDILPTAPGMKALSCPQSIEWKSWRSSCLLPR